MNKNIVLAVCKRDLRSWFGNPTGYVFILLFVAVSAAVMMWSAAFFTNNLANLDTWNDWFPAIALLFVAAATMGMWTSERANGTQELLFTLPAHDSDLLFGKFLAYVAVWTVSLLFTAALPLAVMLLGNPDWGQLFANYIGLWLFGVMLVSVSMVGSQLTHNTTVAFIASALIGGFVVILGPVLASCGFGSWTTNGTVGQFSEFARGMVPVSGIVLFVGLTATFLYLNLALLARRHWRGGLEGAHGIVRSVGFATATLALTVIAVQTLPRFDVTSEGIHSLGAESRKLLAALDPNKPILITAYVSEEVPEQFVQQRRLLLNLLDQFDALGGNAVQTSIVLPKAFSPEARAAESNHNIRAQTVPSFLPGGGYTEMQVFLGFVVSSGTEDVVTPFVEPGVPLEYEITRSIRVVANATRKKIGVLKTDLEIVGGFDFQTFQQKPRWLIADELEQQYKIENVDAEKEYPDGIDCLIVPQPSSLVQEQMDRLEKWILAGHPTMLLEDPVPMSAPGTAADDQKGGMQSRMMGGGGPQKGQFDTMLGKLGIAMGKQEIVWDTSGLGLLGGNLPRQFVFVSDHGLSADSVITRGMQAVVCMMGGYFTDAHLDGFKVEPLLSSVQPMGNEMNGAMPKFESRPGRGDGLLIWDPFGRGPQLNPNARLLPQNRRFDVAVRVTSKQKTPEQKGVNLICVGDVDLVGNTFFQLRRQSNDPNLRFDNVPFVLNCIDSLVGDESLIELRKRRPVLRRLTAVEAAQSTYERTWVAQKKEAEDEAEKALDDAKGRLDSAVDKIRNDATLDESSKERKIVEVEQQENRRFELAKADIDAKKKTRIEQAQHDRDTSRALIHDGYRLSTVLLSPTPALLLGIWTLVRRRNRAAAIVPQNRLVRGGAR